MKYNEPLVVEQTQVKSEKSISIADKLQGQNNIWLMM